MATVTCPPDFNKEDFAKKAKKIYNEKYKVDLESKYKGKFAAIEVESGDCFIGGDMLGAYYEAKKKYFDKYFYFFKIGYNGIKKRTR